MSIRPEDVIVIEFFGHEAATVYSVTMITRTGSRSRERIDRYDVEYCRRDACWYLSRASSNPRLCLENSESKYWTQDPATEVVCYVHEQGHLPAPPENRLAAPPIDFDDFCRRADEVDYTIYCSVCNDFYPQPNYNDVVCRHVRWCDECGWWSTPDERCDHLEPPSPTRRRQ
jgi:hypothetical protein